MKTIKELQDKKITLLQNKQELRDETIILITKLMDQLFDYNRAFRLKENEMIDFQNEHTVKVKGRTYQILDNEYLMNGDVIRNIQYDNLERRRDDLYEAIKVLNEEQEQQLQILVDKNVATRSKNFDIREDLKIKD